MAASAHLNRPDVSILDVGSHTCPDAQVLERSQRTEYSPTPVHFIQWLASKGVAKNGMLLKQLINEIKSISLNAHENLERFARVLQQKTGSLNTSSHLYMAAFAARSLLSRFKIASDEDHIEALFFDPPAVVPTSDSGQSIWRTDFEQAAHTKEMEAREMFTILCQSLAALHEGVACPSHLQGADYAPLVIPTFLRASHNIPAGRFDSGPEVNIAISNSWVTGSSACSDNPSFDDLSIKWTTPESGPANAKMIQNRVSTPEHLPLSSKVYEVSSRRTHPPTGLGAADTPDSISAEVCCGQSKIPVPRSENDDYASAPIDCPADSSQYNLATSDTTAQLPQQSSAQRTALECRMNEILADWERCQDDGSSDSESVSDLDIHAGGPSVSEVSDDLRAECSEETCFTRHGDAPPSEAPGSSADSGTGNRNVSRIGTNGMSRRASQPSQVMKDGDSTDSSGGLIASGQPNRKAKASAKIIPCPIKGCSGKESSMSELLRKLQNAQHGKFVCHNCWCDLKTSDAFGEHSGCEKYCVVRSCKPEDSPDVRHKHDRGSCAEKRDIGSTLEGRKEDEYQYLCHLLGVPSRPLERGSVTAHDGQRKSSCKKDAVTQRSVNQAAEATRLNKLLEIENQDLRRQLEESQAVAQARTEEHLCIIQQSLEERGGTNTRISKSLYRRIKRHAPSVLDGLLHVIDSFGNVTLLTRNSSSVSSLDPRLASSSSSRVSDCTKREADVIDGSDDSPSKRQCPAKSAVNLPDMIATSLPQRLIPTPRELGQYPEISHLGTSHGDKTLPQRRYGSCLAPSMSIQLPSEGSGFLQTQETTMPSKVSTTFSTPWTAHVPLNCQQKPSSGAEHFSVSPPLEDWDFSNSTSQQQQNTTTEQSAFYDMDLSGSQIPTDIINTQDPGAWDESAVGDWLNADTHSGDDYDYSFLNHLPTS